MIREITEMKCSDNGNESPDSYRKWRKVKVEFVGKKKNKSCATIFANDKPAIHIQLTLAQILLSNQPNRTTQSQLRARTLEMQE